MEKFGKNTEKYLFRYFRLIKLKAIFNGLFVINSPDMFFIEKLS